MYCLQGIIFEVIREFLLYIMRRNQKVITVLLIFFMPIFIFLARINNWCCLLQGNSQVYEEKSIIPAFHQEVDVDLFVVDDEQQNASEKKPKQKSLTYEKAKNNVKQMCKSNLNIPTSFLHLSKKLRHILMSHLIVNDHYKFIYCYAPKVACSNWKKVVKRLYGNLRAEDMVHLDHTEGFTYLSDYTDKEIELKLKTYYKFMFVRNPTERALSVYRNKFNEIESFYRVYGSKIMSMYHKDAPKYEGKVPGDDVAFVDFLRYISTGVKAEDMNEHYMPLTTLCQPCAVDYDFIGIYDNIDEDSEMVLRTIKAPEDVHFPVRQTWYKPTSNIFLNFYYSLVPPDILQAFVNKYSLDYQLFSFPKPFFSAIDSKFRNQSFNFS